MRAKSDMDDPSTARRRLIFGVAAAGALAAGPARAETPVRAMRTDAGPDELNGKPTPEPSPAQSAGPIVPGRGSNLAGKVAVVTGADGGRQRK